MGFDENLYASFKSVLLSCTWLPYMDEAYNVLIQDEESKALGRMHEEKNIGVSFAAQTMNRSQTARQMCSVYRKTRHVAENYFKWIGYQSWWIDQPCSKPSVGAKDSRQPFSQSSASLHMNNTRKKNVEPARVNQVFTTPVRAAPSLFEQHTHLKTGDRVGLTGLNDEQWKMLVNMLNERCTVAPDNQSGKFLFESRIIDTDASNHMTGSLSFLVNVSSISPVFIKIPDGRLTMATNHGSVYLGASLTLHNVIYVEGLECHLVSISQLTRERSCVFQITNKIYVIRDRITHTVIGLSEQRNKLYFLREFEEALTIRTSSSLSYEVWHQRLGHTSSKAIKLLQIPTLHNNIGFPNNEACDVCIRPS